MAVKSVNAKISDVLTKAVTTDGAKAGGIKSANQTAKSNSDDNDGLNFGDFLNKKLATDTTSTLAAKTDASGWIKQESAKTLGTDKSSKAQDGSYDAGTKKTGADQNVKTDKTEADKADESREAVDAVEEKPTNAVNEPDKKPAAEEPVDEAVAGQVAEALAQLLETLKQELGVSDEEILAGLEETGLHPTDLFDADSMTLLVTTIAGEGDMLSLVTDGELYTAVQDLTQSVEALSAQLLENTGLTKEELNLVLEQLSVPAEALQENPVGNVPVTDADADTAGEDVASNPAQEENAPVILVTDNTTRHTEVKTTMRQTEDSVVKELSQGSQTTEAQTQERTQTQKSGGEQHDAQNGAKSYDGQQGAVQSFNENVSEAAQTAETVTGYTSETTESLLNQLADVVRIIRNENLTEMELQLHPASLGTVNVSLVTKGGMVTAEFTTQNEAVKAAIEAQAAQLIENLEEQGVKVEAVEVSVASHGLEHELDKNNQGEQSKEEQEEQQRVQGTRRRSINLNSLGEDDGELLDGLAADDATRIAMELMTANGNSMDLLA